MTKKPDFDTTFLKLREILKPYETKLKVVHDTGTNYYLDTPHVMKNKRSMFFAAVRVGKNYVSFHLMPVYAFADLREKISPDLKKRMQGKSCFNFTAPDGVLFQELAKLTKAGFSRFTSKKFYMQF
jgi:hypothetical protein